MSNDRQLLADDEEVLVDTRLHWIPLLGPGLLTAAAVAAAVAIGVGLPQAPVAVAWVLAAMVALPALWLLGRFLRWRGVRIVVTTGRLVYRRGVVGRDVAQLRLQRVAEVHCTQTLRGRLLGCGRLVLEISGGESMVLDDVRRPRMLQRVIANQLDDAWAAGWRGHAGAAGPAGGLWPSSPDAATAVPTAPVRVPAPIAITDTPPHGVAATAGATVLPGSGPGQPPRGGSAVAGGPGGSASGGSVPEQLIALDELRRRGIVTAEEFAAKKAELLRRF